MQLQYDEQSAVPLGEEESFVEFQKDNKTVWMHKDLADSMKTAYRYQGQASKLQTDFEGFKGKIESDQQLAASAAQKEKQEAIDAKIKELRGGDNHNEAHQLEIQQWADKCNSVEESYKKLEENFTGLQTSLVEKENLSLATKIASQYVPAEFVPSFSTLLMNSHIKNVDGKSVFTNASGDAVNNDIERIIEVLNNDPNLKHFAKVPGSKGGYGGKGGNGETNGKVISRRDFDALSGFNQAATIRKGIKVID